MMKELSGDPYACAQQAFHLLNPEATGEDWENWVTKTRDPHTGLDNFHAPAALCQKCLASGKCTEFNAVRDISWAAGIFDALDYWASPAVRKLPISSCVPHHFPRYRQSLVDANAQLQGDAPDVDGRAA